MNADHGVFQRLKVRDVAHQHHRDPRERVLPNTFVVPGLQAKNTVITEDWLCRVEHGAIELVKSPGGMGRVAA